jgi:hypothetical protein
MRKRSVTSGIYSIKSSKYGTKACLQSYTLNSRLLQLASVRCPIGVVSKLQRLQNNVARVVLKADQRRDAGPLLQQLHRPPIGNRSRFKIALPTYKVRSTSTPSYLSSIIITKRPTGYCLRSSYAPQLTIPRVKTEIARRAFRVAPPKFKIICQLVYNLVNQFMFLNRDSKHFFQVYTGLTNVV